MLPEPYYKDDFVTIYHGDCRRILPLLEPVDLVLTDPPYGIGIAANPVRQKHEKAQWDATTVPSWLLLQVVASAKHSIVWGGNYYSLPPSQKFLVWDKKQPSDFSLAMCEIAWCSFPGVAKIFEKRVVGYAKDHPTQKPVELMKWCIGQVPEAKTILDPFMGSGTTLVAAKDLGLKAIGIEQEEKYCQIAVERLRQESLLGIAS